MDEIMEITDFIQDAAGQSAEVIWGYGVDEKLDEDLCVTVIATGFQAQDQLETPSQPRTTVFTLEEEPKEIKAPVQPTQHTQAPPVEALSEEEMPYIKQVEATEEPAPAATGQLFDLVTDEAESAETPEAEPAAADDAPPVTGTNGEPPSVTVYTLESEPLPGTSDEPNLGGIRFTETPPSQPITPAEPPVEQPLSQTPELAPNASREVIQPVARTADGDLQARNQRISQFTRKLKTPGGLADLEAEPAYKRRQVILDDIDHSSKSKVSRFTLHEETDEEGERTIELRNDNPFLHDNVD